MKARQIKQILAAVVLSCLLIQPGFAKKLMNEKKGGYSDRSGNAAGCTMPVGSTEMELNNVRALIHTGGDMWWDLLNSPKYEVPKNSGHMSLFASVIWIGGTDVNGQLRVTGGRYRGSGTDYFTGPLKKYGSGMGTTGAEVCLAYDKHFVMERNDVSEFRSYYRAKKAGNNELLQSQFSDYTVPQSIINWPGNNTLPDYESTLAPFWDENLDGYYNPDDGDYPRYDLDKAQACNTVRREPTLYGDQTLWWVYNDRGNIHTESKGASIGMEIKAQAFAFATNDELNNMTFGNYQLINRSTFTVENCYFGIFIDADLGDAFDDYVGSDVKRGLGYCYNGDENDGDGNGVTYGKQPPAIGVDFFEGPFMDPAINSAGDTVDRPSSYDAFGNLVCDNNYSNGCINGLNFGDGIGGNERWGMRRFVFFTNGSGATGDPSTAVQYYYYLRGFWNDGTRMTYGGNGHQSSTISADFMFPDDTDPCAWGTNGQTQPVWNETTAANQPDDRRFVHSAGPFTLAPGATNDITIGMVWARATSGGAWASVGEVRRADDKAQRLFEVCFKIVDGPNAPELNIIELDRRLLFHIYNIKGSNNYFNTPEDYKEVDPFIACPTSLPNCDNTFTFQGYQVFQLKDESSSVNDIGNVDKARLVFQCDKQDTISRIINFEYDNQLGYSVPKEKVVGENIGIQHSFTLTDDAFATGDKRLVNHKTYYYVAIAYGYNNYKTFNPDDPTALDGQKMPYLPSRTGYGKAIKTYSVIPHISNPANQGTILVSQFGDGPKIKQFSGHGNGNNELKMTTSTINRIMDGPPWKTDTIEYENGLGPIKVKVIDPLNVVPCDFELRFIPDSTYVNTTQNGGFAIDSAKWMMYKVPAESREDTIWSDANIVYLNEQIIPKWGISVTIKQIPWPATDNPQSYQNGYINSSEEYANPSYRWLELQRDVDGCGWPNWIRSGSNSDPSNSNCDDYNGSAKDKDQFFEKVVGGTWAPYTFVMADALMDQYHGLAYRQNYNQATFIKRLSSVQIVITKDKSKWSRCPVFEMCEYDIPALWKPGLSEGSQYKFGIRRHKSVNKDGSTSVIGDSLTDENASNYIASNGMGWFPGYAIDVETGERLNIAFGEDSHYPAENGADMLWNPTANYASSLYYTSGGTQGDLYLGGKHVIWVWGHNNVKTNTAYSPAYDGGKYLYTKLFNLANENGTAGITKKSVWANPMWVSVPMLSPYFPTQANPTDPYYFIASDITYNISVANPYQQSANELAIPNDTTWVGGIVGGTIESINDHNNNLPHYSFNTRDLVPVKNDNQTAKEALDLIKVVPNPYYGYSAYEKSQLDYKIKFTNLPQNCTISIFTVNGTLIRRFKKDSPLSYQDWDLKNEYGILVASGLYIIHIDAPGIGEKILKWFGVLRPIDLNNF